MAEMPTIRVPVEVVKQPRLEKFNRSALITAVLSTAISLASWAIYKYASDEALKGVLIYGVTTIGTALGVVSNSRKGLPPPQEIRPGA